MGPGAEGRADLEERRGVEVAWPAVVGRQTVGITLRKVEGPLGTSDLLEAAVEDLGRALELRVVGGQLGEGGHRAIRGEGNGRILSHPAGAVT